jgi:hypothetical protein
MNRWVRKQQQHDICPRVPKGSAVDMGWNENYQGLFFDLGYFSWETDNTKQTYANYSYIQNIPVAI